MAKPESSISWDARCTQAGLLQACCSAQATSERSVTDAQLVETTESPAISPQRNPRPLALSARPEPGDVTDRYSST